MSVNNRLLPAQWGTPHDFDFLVGTWDVVNRRLAQRWVSSDSWDVFLATAVSYSILQGGGNVDEMHVPTRNFAGMTLRLFDIAKEEWSLYWINSKTGTLFPPVVGRFEDGRGVFFGDDSDDGSAVRVRFIWSHITAESARWEQAFSADGEATWETNWVMEFTRTDVRSA